MKKVALTNPKAEVIRFLARGQRGSATAVELVIDAEGTLAHDADAALALERFGDNIVVTEVDAKAEAAKLIEKAGPTAEELAAEEARRAALTDEEREAEDKAKAEAEEKAKADAAAAKAAAKTAKAAAKTANKPK